jgi:hypothetical protein
MRAGTQAQASVAGANRASANRASYNRGNVDRGNVDTGDIRRGNINTGDVNIGNDVDIDIDGGHGWHGDIDYPIAAGIVAGAYIGAVAVTTAAVVGSAYYALPPSGCVTIISNGVSYYQCGSVYYQRIWRGSDVVYVVVDL